MTPQILRGDMYRLRDLKNGLFQIHTTRYGAYEGTPKTIFNEAIRFGIRQNDLTIAVNELHRTNDDYADFGVLGTFLYTAKDKYGKGNKKN